MERWGCLQGGRLCLRMVNRKKKLNYFEAGKTLNKNMRQFEVAHEI